MKQPELGILTLLISLSFLMNFILKLGKKGEINDVWKTMFSSCKILNQPHVFKQTEPRQIVMEVSLGGVQGVMQINAQNPRKRLS